MQFVPGHPLAGTEHSGPDAGFASLFDNRWCILTPPPGTDPAAVEALAAFWTALGARVDTMEPAHHDLVLAVTSHVPHLIAYTMVGVADDLSKVTEQEVINYSAGGFRDFTRIAASDPTMWRDVFLANKDAMLDILGRFTEDLRAAAGDPPRRRRALHAYFTRTRAIRRGIIEAGQDTAAPDFGRGSALTGQPATPLRGRAASPKVAEAKRRKRMDDANIRDAPGFLEGGGELGRLIAGFDWSATPLGPSWAGRRACARSSPWRCAPRCRSPSSSAATASCSTTTPTARSPVRGTPSVLGLPVREGWPEVAAFNDDVIRTVLAGGTLSFRDQELTLRRNGVRRAGLARPRLFADRRTTRGRPGGVIVYVIETTDRVMFERAVAGERERLRQMFEQAPSFMAMLRGPEHVFDLANAAYLQLIGHRDVIGKPVREALPDVAGQGYFELLDRVYASGERFIGSGTTVSLQRTPGAMPEERIVDFVYHPIRGGDGQVVGIFVQGIDITERIIAERALRESEAQLRIFAESMPNHVWAARAGRARSTGSTTGSTNTSAPGPATSTASGGRPRCTPTTGRRPAPLVGGDRRRRAL